MKTEAQPEAQAEPQLLLTAFELRLANQSQEEAKEDVAAIAPKASFVFLGVDKTYIYFRVAAKLAHISQTQIRDLEEKTRFIVVKSNTQQIFTAEYKQQYQQF